MKYRLITVLMMMNVFWISSSARAADQETLKSLSLETFMIEPIDATTIHIWVPADKVGPKINRACQDRAHNLYTCQLPADVIHAKTDNCLSGLARLLAEYVWPDFKENLPLTIFNGWKWEFVYSLSQHETVEYKLGKRGGAWENMVEAIFSETLGSVQGGWVSACSSSQTPSVYTNQKSDIEVRSFSSLRSRNGYPKQRQLR